MSTYDFEPNPDDYGPEPSYIARPGATTIKIRLPPAQVLKVTSEGEFIWHPDAANLIENGDYFKEPAMKFILRRLLNSGKIGDSLK